MALRESNAPTGTQLAYWNFEVPEGTKTVPDLSGGGHVLTMKQHWIEKVLGDASFAKVEPLQGLGQSSGLTFPYLSSAEAKVPPFRTASFWMKRAVGCCDRLPIILDARRILRIRYLRVLVNGGYLVASLGARHGLKTDNIRTPLGKATEEKFQHVAVVFTSTRLSLYLDGEMKASKAVDFNDWHLGAEDLTIQLGAGSMDQLKPPGAMDEVRFYQEALTGSDVQLLAAATGVPDGFNVPPVAEAGQPQSLVQPVTSVSLTGACQDPDAGPAALTAAWTLASAPGSSPRATFDNASSLSPLVSFDAPAPAGDYTFTLACSDGKDTRSSSVTVAMSAAPPAPVETLAAHWRFEQPVGTRFVLDDSGSGRELALRSASSLSPFAELRPSEGLGGGSGVRFYAGSGATAAVPAFRTLSLWLKRDVGCCSAMINLLVARRRSNGAVFVKLWAVKGRLRLYARGAVGLPCLTSVPDSVASEARWQHIAVTLSSAVELYVDGQRKGRRSCLGDVGDVGGDDVSFRVGVAAWGQFKGILDEVRLYTDVVGAGTLAALGSTTAASAGGLLASEQELRADAGPAQSLWQPVASASLGGACQGPAGTQAQWSIASAPAPGSATLADAASALTTLSFDPSAPPGDYALTLTCSANGKARTSSLTVAVFEAHEGVTGSTVRTPARSPGGFAQAGQPVAPLGLWLFDGDASNQVAGGPHAQEVQVRGGPVQLDFGVAGRFGGAVRITCGWAACVQLDLGNPETAPWPALSVSFWFKSNKTFWSAFFRKGSYRASPLQYTKDTWHHVVLTQDEHITKLYMDGVPCVVKSGASARSATDAADRMTFGVRGGFPAFGFEGVLDDLAVFGFVLSNDEVEALNLRGARSFLARLGGNPYWRGGYTSAMLGSYFPPLPEEPSYAGFSRDPRAPPPAPYVHPRVFLTPEELPALRERLRSGTAARVGMEDLRSLLMEDYPPAAMATRNLTLAEVDSAMAQRLVSEAFRCLIDADRAAARRLGQQLESLADEMRAALQSYSGKAGGWVLGADSYDESDTWGTHHHGVVLKVGAALMYDFLYPYLAASTRQRVREALSLATAGTWSVGMDAVPAAPAATSGQLPSLTGDLVLNLLAIEGEDGFDEGVFERAAKAYGAWTTLGVSSASGATFEGGGTSALSGTKLLALAGHGYPQYIAAKGTRKFATEFLLHTMLPNGNWWQDDLFGGIEKKPQAGDVIGLKSAFPNDTVIDYLYRRALDAGSGAVHERRQFPLDLPYRGIQDRRPSTEPFGNQVSDIIYALDSSGPADLQVHAASALAGQNLTYVAEDRGLVVTRSAWADPDAAWLLLNVRSQPGGRAAAARGEFAFYALGEVWAHYPGGLNQLSALHGVVLVDGQGQGAGLGRLLGFSDAPQATLASCDLRYPYSGAPWGEEAPSDFSLGRGPHKWAELPHRLLPGGYNGVAQSFLAGGTGSLDDFAMAFRTVGLVRCASPYALVLDDFQKDSQSREYAWRMPLSPERVEWDMQLAWHRRVAIDYSSATPSGSDLIIPAGTGTARLLVRLLPGSSNATLQVEGTYVAIKARASAARFRVLLFPHREGEALPTTTWDGTAETLTVERSGGGTDVLTLREYGPGMTSVESMTVDGTPVSFAATTEVQSPSAQ